MLKLNLRSYPTSCRYRKHKMPIDIHMAICRPTFFKIKKHIGSKFRTAKSCIQNAITYSCNKKEFKFSWRFGSNAVKLLVQGNLPFLNDAQAVAKMQHCSERLQKRWLKASEYEGKFFISLLTRISYSSNYTWKLAIFMVSKQSFVSFLKTGMMRIESFTRGPTFFFFFG